MAKQVPVKYSFADKVKRVLWYGIWNLTIRPIPRGYATKWERIILNLFGAKVSKTACIHSSAKILMPSNLIVEDYATISDHVYIENSTLCHIMAHAIVSQQTYICNGTHDIWEKSFPPYSAQIIIGRRAWVSARCLIGPGVKIGDGAVVSAGSVVFKNVKPWKIVAGNPAQVIADRDVDWKDDLD